MRGIGRERLARYVSEFLLGAGFRVDESQDTAGGNPSSRIEAILQRPNPAVPPSLQRLLFRTSPTAGGAALRWEVPEALAQPSEKARALRFATELQSNLEQRVALESRGAGRLTRDQALPPFLPPTTGSAAGPASGSTPGTSDDASGSGNGDGPGQGHGAGRRGDRNASADEAETAGASADGRGGRDLEGPR